MTRIKICGLTTENDVRTVNALRPDYAGFVLYYPKSRRDLSPEQAASLLRLLDPAIKSVAVTVSPTQEQAKIIASLGFSYIQIHGTLCPGILEQPPLPVLRAFNVSDMELYESYKNCGAIAGYVFDAQTPGSGSTFDWSLVKELSNVEKPWLLAGGLHPGNVADAIQKIHPWGVDVSSGVETKDIPGKDPEKIRAFIEAVRNLQK